MSIPDGTYILFMYAFLLSREYEVLSSAIVKNYVVHITVVETVVAVGIF